MEITYDSHIVKLKRGPSWDEPKIGHILGQLRLTSRGVIARLSLGENKKTVENPRSVSDLGDLSGYDHIDLIGRSLTKSGSKAGGEDDENDYNAFVRSDDAAFRHAGERLTTSISSNSLRGCPMFFRDIGSPLDMIDLYLGGTLFLVLNGPSVGLIDVAKLKLPGVMTFGVNNGAHVIVPNFWTCVDDPQRFLNTIWRNPSITKFVPMAHFIKPTWDHVRGVPGQHVRTFPNVVGYRRNEKFSANSFLRETTVNWGSHGDLGGGRSCMLAAIRIAYLLGFRKIFLIGCDFRMSPTEKYFFDEERHQGAIKGNNNSYAILTNRFRQLLPVFADAGLEVFNCNPSSALDVFPFADYEKSVLEASIDLSASTRGMYVDGKSGRRKDQQ